jgi:predicted RND superfamily exporter protein
VRIKEEGKMGKLEKFFGKQVVKLRWLIIVASILVLAVAGSGARHLTVSNDMRIFFSDENPQLQALETLENTYTKNDTVLFVVAPKNGDVFTRETLAAVQELTESSWKIPYSGRVDSISNFQHTWSEEDDLIVEDLVPDAASLSDEDLTRIREIALTEPLLVDRLISSSGHVTGVTINVTLPGDSVSEADEVTAFARGLHEDLKSRYTDLDVYLTGGVIFDFSMGEVATKDMTTLVPAMFLVLLVIIMVTLRSIVSTLATFVIIVFSMITGMGLAGWLGITITTPSANAPLIIMTLAVADSIHILVTILSKMRSGESRHGAIAESIRINLMPVFLTSVTTAIGFLTMNFSDAPPFRDLGNIVAMGVMAAFVYSVLFLPALMAVIPIRVGARASKADSRSCARLADFVIARRRVIFWATLVLVAVLAVGITRIELYDNWVEYFDERFEIRQATDFATDNMIGFDIIEYSLNSGEPGGISDPEYLATVESFANWYRSQSKVIHVHTIADTMKRLNMNMHSDDRSFYRIPEQRDLAAQYLLLYEMSLPFGLDLNNEINVDKSATRVTVSLRDITTNELRDMDEKARNWLSTNAPESMFTYGSGLSIMWAHISQRNINSMLSGAGLALGLISLIMIFALGSVRLGVLSLIPNFAPALMAFGVWGLTVGQVGLGLSIVISLTIGIVVDDTVHFLSKYIRARREHGLDPADAIRFAFDTVGTAMVITTTALVAGFLVLSLSGFKMNADLGLMTAITISMALAMDFLFLPALLMKVEGMKDEETTADIDLVLAPAAAVSSRRSG